MDCGVLCHVHMNAKITRNCYSLSSIHEVNCEDMHAQFTAHWAAVVLSSDLHAKRGEGVCQGSLLMGCSPFVGNALWCPMKQSVDLFTSKSSLLCSSSLIWKWTRSHQELSERLHCLRFRTQDLVKNLSSSTSGRMSFPPPPHCDEAARAARTPFRERTLVVKHETAVCVAVPDRNDAISSSE